MEHDVLPAKAKRRRAGVAIAAEVLAGNSQTPAALGPAAAANGAAMTVRHASTESMHLGAAPVVRLICTLHDNLPTQLGL